MKRYLAATTLALGLVVAPSAAAIPPGAAADKKVTTTVTGSCAPVTATLATTWKNAHHGTIAFWPASAGMVESNSGNLLVANGTLSYSRNFAAAENGSWGAEYTLYDKSGRLLYDAVVGFTVAC